MAIAQIYTYGPLRNFSYLVFCPETKEAVCIDPFDGQQIQKELESRSLHLISIINTHEHWDHTCGNDHLVKKYGAEVIYQEGFLELVEGATRGVSDGEELLLGQKISLKAVSTPGHTRSHLSYFYYEEGRLKGVFSGDTLFNAGVGNCNNGGDPEVLFETIEQCFDQVDGDVILYPGHDYLENNLNFTLSICPENNDARQLLDEISGKEFNEDPRLFNVEKKVNLFLKNCRSQLTSLGKTDKEIFINLRKRRDAW